MRISEKPAREARPSLAAQAGGLSGPASRRLPVPPRERKPALAALAVLLILGGALATTLLVLRSGDRVSAIRITAQVGAGQKLTPDVMEEVQIADTGIGYVPWSQRAAVARTFARVTLLPGTLLTAEMTSSVSEEVGPGKARVGLSLKPGQMPADLRPGDRVQVIYVPAKGSGANEESRVLAQNALVHSTGGGRGSGSNGLVTVVVDSSISPTIAAFSSTGEIALAELTGAS